MFNYWNWFFRGTGGPPGYRRLLNTWLVVHLIVGAGVSYFVRVDLCTAANSVLLPLAGIFVGLAFAWAGNAMALMQTKEIEQLADKHQGGFADYVYVYQTAILAILVTMVLWGLAGMKAFEMPQGERIGRYVTYATKIFLFSLSSMALRECWQVVLGSQWLLIAQREIKKRGAESGPKNEKKK